MASQVDRHQCDATVASNCRLQGEYFRIELTAAALARQAQPGQFVHLQLPGMAHRILRRPFSICDADGESGTLAVVYKVVGEGTRTMAELQPGDAVNALGPLGRGYTPDPPGCDEAVLVGGGYGCAAVYLLAKRSSLACRCLFGGRTAGDILLVDEFKALGCDVELSTEDGTAGHRGLVTDLLEDALDHRTGTPAVYACGPNPMLEAVARIVDQRGLDAEVSLDHEMCCGVGACFTCVVRKRADNENGWEYVRTCLDGPVFRASEIWWGEPARKE